MVKARFPLDLVWMIAKNVEDGVGREKDVRLCCQVCPKNWESVKPLYKMLVIGSVPAAFFYLSIETG